MTRTVAGAVAAAASEGSHRKRNTAGNALGVVERRRCTIAVTQHDAETRFRTLSARGSIDEGLRLLDKLDDALGARE